MLQAKEQFANAGLPLPTFGNADPYSSDPYSTQGQAREMGFVSYNRSLNARSIDTKHYMVW